MVGATAQISTSYFEDCKAKLSAGAVSASELDRYPAVPLTAMLQCQGCTFRKNLAIDRGGAVAVSAQSAGSILHSTFIDNSAESGGAFAVTGQSTITIQGSQFDRNTASGLGGGALRVQSSTVTLVFNTFTRNTASAGGGGGLLWDGDTEMLVHLACKPGWHAESAGGLDNGRAYCEPCPAGSYKDKADGSRCTLCKPGKYNDEVSQTTCARCVAGKYQNQMGATQCVTCPENSNATLAHSSTDCVCHAGYIGDGLTGCTPCPAHSTSFSGDRACFCNAGYGGDGSSECTACEAGKYHAGALTVDVAFLAMDADLTSDWKLGTNMPGVFHGIEIRDWRGVEISRLSSLESDFAQVQLYGGMPYTFIPRSTGWGWWGAHAVLYYPGEMGREPELLFSPKDVTLYGGEEQSRTFTLNISQGCAPCPVGTSSDTPGATACTGAAGIMPFSEKREKRMRT